MRPRLVHCVPMARGFKMLVRLALITFTLLLPAESTDYLYTVRRAHSGGVSTASLRSAPKTERRAWKFQPKNIWVVGTVKERMANTKVTFSADPVGSGKLAEITMRIPDNAYVNYLEMKIGGEIFVGEVKKREEARQDFEDAISSGQSASLVESKGSSFSVMISLEAGETADITVGYEQYLALHLGSYDYNLALDTHEDSNAQLPAVLVQIDVDESDGLSSIAVPKPNFDCAFQATAAGNNYRTCGLEGSDDKAWIRFLTLNTASVFLAPTQQDQTTSKWGGSSSGLSLDLIVRITPMFTFESGSVGGTMMIDEESGRFVHMFNAGQTTSMNKAVVLMVDRSGSMMESAGARSRMEQATTAVSDFLGRLHEDDYFSVGMFNSWVEWWETPHLKQATRENVQRAIQWVQWHRAEGGTDINQALIESLAVFSGGEVFNSYDYLSDYGVTWDKCHEWNENRWKRTWGAVTAACTVLLTGVFICSIGVAMASMATRSALEQLTPSYTHPQQSPAYQSGVIINGSHFGTPEAPPSSSEMVLQPAAGTTETRPAPLVPGTCVQGLNMGASTEGQEAGAAVTDSTPDSQPPPPPPPPPPLPYAPDFPSDQQSHEIPDHGPWYPEATAPPASDLAQPLSQQQQQFSNQSQPHHTNRQGQEHIPVAEPYIATAALQPQPQQHLATPYPNPILLEAACRSKLACSARWAVALLVLSILTLAVSWTTFLVPLSALAALCGIVTASLVLHTVRTAQNHQSAADLEQNRPGTCCCSTWVSCMGCACGWSVATSVIAGLAIVLCLIWSIVLLLQGQHGHANCFNDPGYQNSYMPETYSYEPVECVRPEELPGVLYPRSNMVIFLSDGHATSGVTYGWNIAENARRQVASMSSPKAAVFGVAFGRNADWDLLQLISKGTGATATRVYDDNEMDVQLEELFSRVSSAAVTGLDLQYSALASAECVTEECMLHCAAAEAAASGGECVNCDMDNMCRMTLQPETTVFSNSVVVRAGRLPTIPGLGRATAVKVVVSGRWEGKVHKLCDKDYCFKPIAITFGAGRANTLVGDQAKAAEQIWAHLSVREAVRACPLIDHPNQAQDIPTWTRSGCAWGVPPEVVSEATDIAIGANLVTPLTSLVVRKHQQEQPPNMPATTAPPSTTPVPAGNATKDVVDSLVGQGSEEGDGEAQEEGSKVGGIHEEETETDGGVVEKPASPQAEDGYYRADAASAYGAAASRFGAGPTLRLLHLFLIPAALLLARTPLR